MEWTLQGGVLSGLAWDQTRDDRLGVVVDGGIVVMYPSVRKRVTERVEVDGGIQVFAWAGSVCNGLVVWDARGQFRLWREVLPKGFAESHMDGVDEMPCLPRRVKMVSVGHGGWVVTGTTDGALLAHLEEKQDRMNRFHVQITGREWFERGKTFYSCAWSDQIDTRFALGQEHGRVVACGIEREKVTVFHVIEINLFGPVTDLDWFQGRIGVTCGNAVAWICGDLEDPKVTVRESSASEGCPVSGRFLNSGLYFAQFTFPSRIRRWVLGDEGDLHAFAVDVREPQEEWWGNGMALSPNRVLCAYLELPRFSTTSTEQPPIAQELLSSTARSSSQASLRGGVVRVFAVSDAIGTFLGTLERDQTISRPLKTSDVALYLKWNNLCSARTRIEDIIQKQHHLGDHRAVVQLGWTLAHGQFGVDDEVVGDLVRESLFARIDDHVDHMGSEKIRRGSMLSPFMSGVVLQYAENRKRMRSSGVRELEDSTKCPICADSDKGDYLCWSHPLQTQCQKAHRLSRCCATLRILHEEPWLVRICPGCDSAFQPLASLPNGGLPRACPICSTMWPLPL